MKLIIDTSNVLKAGLFNGVDKEYGRKVEHNGKMTQVNGAEYGFDAAVRFLKARLDEFALTPRDMIFVTEGPDSKTLRKSIWDQYSANRAGRYPPEQYTEVAKGEEMLLRQFLDLGALAVTQKGLEADDIIAYLAQKLPCIIVSTDGDLQQCVGGDAHLWRDGQLDVNRYGPFPIKYTTLYKALVGDTSDNIKGAKGFGDKAFLDLYCMWGDEGLAEMERMVRQRCLEELQQDVPSLKALQRIVDDREGVYRSWALACQYPEHVNTWRRPLEWRAGMVKPKTAATYPDLEYWAGRKKIVHQDNFDQSLAFFTEMVTQSPQVELDIETSTCDESDDWIERKKKKVDDVRVDVFGSTLTGMGLTFGENDQYSMYLTVDHVEEADVKNITKAQVAQFVKAIPRGKASIVHNAAFELSVLAREIGEYLADNGEHGFLPNVIDTRVMASYANENEKQGLKDLSSAHLGYEQVDYATVTKGRRMNQMTARETVDYGLDDTICTAAHFNRLKVILDIEGTYDAMLQVEQDAAYMGALAYNQGCNISMERLLELEREDKEAFDNSAVVLRQFLIDNGWEGTVCPQLKPDEPLTPAFVKDAYKIVYGKDLCDASGKKTQVRILMKLLAMIRAEDDGTLAQFLEAAIVKNDRRPLNNLLTLHFQGNPDFNIDSPVQKCRLLYDVMKLPVRIRNLPTEVMRAAGIKEGNPKADDYALQWALQDDLAPGTAEYAALKALQVMLIANTRRKLYYEPYKLVQHWKDNLVHSDLRQCGPVTRRYSDADPNKQQLPKNRKATGEMPKFRQVYVPHHKRAVIVSFDFKGQELVLIADYSGDENLLACFVGDHKKDMHALTAAGILKKKALAGRDEQLFAWATGKSGADANFRMLVDGWKAIDYTGFVLLKDDPLAAGVYKACRELGKKTNFTTEYGAQKKKLSETLLVPQIEAQEYLEARQAAFPRAEEWKREVIEELHRTGYATTKMGARRHLAEALASGNGIEVGAAERQAVNFKIQGSAAEQTKLAMGRFWRAGICFKYDARFIGPIHDEVVFSVSIEDLMPFLHEVHALMIAPYADMKVPIVSSISFGLNFGEQIEMGEAVNDAAFERELANLFPDEYRKAA